VYFTDLSIVKDILDKGGVPLFGGDVAFSEHKKTAIASADALAVALSSKFKKSKLFFATDTDGVYATFPPQKSEKPLQALNRSGLKILVKTMHSKITHRDVTGAMSGKLHALLHAKATTATIFNGNTRGILAEALSGKKRGTQITL
jgi:isopentenyl phosphate kinase